MKGKKREKFFRPGLGKCSVNIPGSTGVFSRGLLFREAARLLRRDESGFALLLSMLVLLAMTFLGMAAMTTSSLENRIAGSYQLSKQAFEGAEACLQEFYAGITDPDFNQILNPQTLVGRIEIPGSERLVRYRPPVYDPATDVGYRYHPNYNGTIPSERFGVPRPPNPRYRSAQQMPGMNIARRGSQTEGGMWSYQIWEVECQGWVDHPDVNPDDDTPLCAAGNLDCAVDWAVSVYSLWGGIAKLAPGVFAESPGGTGH